MSTINIHQSYTTQLANERQANAVLRQNEAEAQGRLAAMAMLLRQAYEAQTNSVDSETIISGLRYENAVLREALGLPREEELINISDTSGAEAPGRLISIPGGGGGGGGEI